MKKKVKVRLIISGAICSVVTILGGIIIAADGENFFVECGLGLFLVHFSDYGRKVVLNLKETKNNLFFKARGGVSACK